MRRYVFKLPQLLVDVWIRVRDECDFVTLSLKSFDHKKGIDSVQKLEVKVSDFDTTVFLFEALGYPKSFYVENYREVWQLQDCQITLDE